MYEAETVDVPKGKVRVCSKKGMPRNLFRVWIGLDFCVVYKKPRFEKSEMHRDLPFGYCGNGIRERRCYK
jgi:hypothetical protein